MSLGPLLTRLKRRAHRELALAQDLVVVEAFNSFPGAVLHGGTAIWRCYGGNRFSEDIGLYLPRPSRGEVDDFVGRLARQGLGKQKLKLTANALFGKFTYADSPVRVEAVFRASRGHTVRPFEMADGTLITVNVLRPLDLLLEKVSAYNERRKVRDLYDVYFLTRLVGSDASARAGVRGMVESFRPPEDQSVLRALIVTGSAPTVQTMLEEVEGWAR